MLSTFRPPFTTVRYTYQSFLRSSHFYETRSIASSPSVSQTSIPKMISLSSEKTASEVINLGKGHPCPKFLRLNEVQNGLNMAMNRPAAHVEMLQYGRMQGNELFCTQISQWLKESSPPGRVIPSPENIMITTGSGPAMTVVSQLYSNPGDTIFVDSPGYFLAYYTFTDCKLNVVNIQTDKYGMDIDDVERRLKAGERPSLLYTVPFGNNPSGVSMSEDRKRRLVELSRDYGFKIMSDEVYQFLSFTDKIPTSLYEFDDPSKPTVFSMNSFSKILGPGLRLGWLSTAPKHMERLLDCGSLQSGGGFNPFTSVICSEMMKNGFVARHANTVRDDLHNCAQILCNAIEKYMRPALKEGEEMTYYRPTGGFFCFIHLPKRFDADELLVVAKQKGVSYFCGKHSSPDKSSFKNCIRLCFAFVDDQIEEGVRRIGEAMKDYQ